MELKTLVASLALQQIKIGMCAVATQETWGYIEYTCKIQWFTIFMLGLSILGLVLCCHYKIKKIKTV